MKSNKNLIKGVVMSVRVGTAKVGEAGVFKTAQGKFVVKVVRNNKLVQLGIEDDKNVAIALYNQNKAL